MMRLVILFVSFYFGSLSIGQFPYSGEKISLFSLGRGFMAEIPKSVTLYLSPFYFQSITRQIENSDNFEFDYNLGIKKIEENSIFSDYITATVNSNLIVSTTTSSKTVNVEFELAKTLNKNNREHIYTWGKIEGYEKYSYKTKQLDFNPRIGRISNFDEFNKLEVIRTQQEDYKLGIRLKHLYSGMAFKYPGDLGLWNDLVKAKNLKELVFVQRSNHFEHDNAGEVYLLGGMNSSFLASTQLESIFIEGLDFFSVDYHSMKNLKNIVLTHLDYPEVLTLASAMYLLGKDTLSGNWSQFLNYINLIELKELPFNGDYTVYYKNGTPLCKGTFINGKPHGRWEFRYQDSAICQIRNYANGQRTGDWKFKRPPSGITLIDSVVFTELQFRNDSLISRIEQKLDFTPNYESDCSSYEDKYQAIHRVEYEISYLSSNTYTINKNFLSLGPVKRDFSFSLDTLLSLNEKWNYNELEWNYELNMYCYNQKTPYYTEFLKGELYQGCYYSSVTKRSFNSKSERIIDLKNCVWSNKVYLWDDNLLELMLIEENNKSISSDEWLCID